MGLKPMEPTAMEPEATELAAMEPKPMGPTATEPKPTGPIAMEPKPMEPKLMGPTAMEPKPMELKAMEPKPMGPTAMEPQAMGITISIMENTKIAAVAMWVKVRLATTGAEEAEAVVDGEQENSVQERFQAPAQEAMTAVINLLH